MVLRHQQPLLQEVRSDSLDPGREEGGHRGADVRAEDQHQDNDSHLRKVPLYGPCENKNIRNQVDQGCFMR